MTNNINSTSPVNPSEVGWQFVPQYYTFVNKQPGRLHCFYTKASTFIHGTEGEDGKPCYGQQEIHAKITSIGFQDCKVFIHSVDAQSSANGGIIIQVIGEMSNHGDPWRKFVQTFFLAEQPNGYFVLNDIFRFLKEEAVEDDQASDTEAPTQDQPVPSAPESVASAITVPAPLQAESQPQRVPTPPPATPPAPPAEESIADSEPRSEPQQANGIHEAEEEPVSASLEEPPSPVQSAPEPPATASPPPVSPAAPAHQPLAPSPAPPAQPQEQAAPATQQVPPAPAPTAPTPSAPPRPKTWAHLAAADSKKWGAAVAQESRGTSEIPVASSAPAPSGVPHSPGPHARSGPQNPAYLAAVNVTTAACFVKSVTENVSEAALRSTLTARFGPIKELEIVRQKACAFLEFNNIDAAKRAIVASLSVPQGGEGGIRIGEGSEGVNAPKILVETRKERGDRPPPRGPPMNGGDARRGAYRGGRGGPGGGRGRGVPQK